MPPDPVPSFVIYTDGACQGNPGPGGWAWAEAPDGVVYGSCGEKPSTNQRMELKAVLEALRAHPEGEIEIVSDSTYVVNCFNASPPWWKGWLARGWRNSQKQPVANRDLWEPLIELYQARRPQPKFRWVKGHSGEPMNERVDQLAVAAANGPWTTLAITQSVDTLF